MPLTEGLVSRKACIGPPTQSFVEKRKKKPYIAVLKFNPNHSTEDGRFTSGAGGGAGKNLSPAQREMQRELARQSKKRVHKVHSAEEAVELVLKGENVEIQNTKAVHTVLKKLGEMALRAKSLNRKAPNFDPCTITVKGVSLFCSEKLKTPDFPQGLPRIEMPQFKSKNPVPGSEADKLPKDENGEVDASQAFLRHLTESGVKTNPNGTILARKLKASQAEMEGAKVAGMMLDPSRDPKKQRIWVSKDGYVIDGHHTWAAAVGRDAEDGNLDNDMEMDVVVVDLPMSEIYHLSRMWTQKFGLPAAGVKKIDAVRILKFNMHHDAKGRFATTGSGGVQPSAEAHSQMTKLVERIQEPDGGFTMHPTTGQEPTTGFALSVYKGRERVIPIKDLTPLDLVMFVKDNSDLAAQDGNYVGAWHNPDNGKVYLDISRVEQSQAKAEALGREHNQLAIFDLSAGRSITLQKAA